MIPQSSSRQAPPKPASSTVVRCFVFGVLALVALAAGRASAEPVTLRLASIVPEGTSWARVFRAFARDVEAQSNGQVRVKWYLGGIAGDETEVPKRIARGQLDGEAASVTCSDMAPSLRVLRIVGMFRRREEAHAVIAHLRPQLETEFRKAGFVPLAITWIGSDLAFSREPIKSMEDLKRLRLWIWSLDPVWMAQMKALGINAVPLPVEEAARAYEEGRLDGFLALPNAALAFQWAAKTRFFSNLTLASMASCMVISSTVLEALPFESQAAVRAAAAKATLHFEDASGAQEDALIGGLFERQGTHLVDASPAFRAQFLETARLGRDRLSDEVVPRTLVTRVLGWLSDFRAERP